MRDLKYLTTSQRRGLEQFEDERARLEYKEAQFLAACAENLDIDPNDPAWRFNRNERSFERTDGGTADHR